MTIYKDVTIVLVIPKAKGDSIKTCRMLFYYGGVIIILCVFWLDRGQNNLYLDRRVMYLGSVG